MQSNTRAGHTSTHRIHIVLAGHNQSLCQQPSGLPTKWPEGHLYATVPPGNPVPPVVNCPECLVQYQQRWRG